MKGRDPITGEVKGVVRPGGPSGRACASWRVVNNPKSLSVVATQDPVVAAALEQVMARQADEISKYLSGVAVTPDRPASGPGRAGQPGAGGSPGRST